VLRHVVVFRWKEGTTTAQVDAIMAALSALPDQIPELRAYRFGVDAGLSPGNADFAVVADADDEAGWAVYRDHPAHRRVIEELISPVIETRTAVQYVIPDR
jgi:Stress responsive A/B Barrel Domain